MFTLGLFFENEKFQIWNQNKSNELVLIELALVNVF